MREKVLLGGEQSLKFKDTLLENPNSFPSLCPMPLSRHSKEILYPVIILNSIDMVNNPIRGKCPISLFPDMSVLIDMLAVNRNNYIATSGFLPSTSFPERSKVSYTASLKSYITFLATFRVFPYQLTTLAEFIFWITGKTFLAISRFQFKRFITLSTYFNHIEIISCLRSIVKEVIHA